MTDLISVSDKLEFTLGNARISYAFRVSPEGLLEHLYFGNAVPRELPLPGQPRRTFRCTTTNFEGIENYNLSDIPQEFPLFGTSESRQPAMHLLNADGNTTNVLRYQSHRLLDEKPRLEGLPSARGAGLGASQTLIVELHDLVSRLQVELSYSVYRDHDLIARSAKVLNQGDQPIELLELMSTSIDLPADEYELLHLGGTWSRELNTERMSVPAGRFTIDSAIGTSGNHHNPFLAVMEKGTSETQGRVLGMALMYSGNFAIRVERGEFGSVRASMGINPFNFRWKLEPGESFVSPEALQVFSGGGLEGMSQIWHQFIAAQVSPSQWRGVPRPTYLNSWEAAYFDINHQRVIDLADRAKSLGLEMLVVDDGWFKGRNNDHSSLGDWCSDPEKFPQGILHTAAEVSARGLKFGLWFEPEMVNPDSDLYRLHPDWTIQVPGRTPSIGRNQLILDLSQSRVVEYLFERLDGFLSSGCIHYVKWDMNRTMTEIGSTDASSDRQLETPHRYMLGLYELVSRLTQKYPEVLFENCASGGNRFDLGMLSYMSQSWLSDMSEPVGRLKIQQGASYLFPPSVMASYIGPVPSHQNDRMVSLKLRAEVAFFCAARGLSLNLNDIGQDQQALMDWVRAYKQTAADVVEGRFRRLRWSGNEVCWQLNSVDGARVYLSYFHILSAPNLPFSRIRLRGLDSESVYAIEGTESAFSGSALMNQGLDMPYVHAMQLDRTTDYMDHGDFSSRLWVLRKQA